MRKLHEELEAAAQVYATRTSPEGNVPVDQDLDRVPGCKFGGSHSNHARAAAEKVSDKKNAAVTPGLGLKKDEIIDADGDAGPRR